MIMRFRGDGVGHTSTRAATNVFKGDRDILDMKFPHDALPATESTNVEEQDEDMDITAEDLEGEMDEDGDLSESEVVDYGYGPEGDSGEDDEVEEEQEDGEVGEEDDMTIDELDMLGYADY